MKINNTFQYSMLELIFVSIKNEFFLDLTDLMNIHTYTHTHKQSHKKGFNQTFQKI